MWIYPKISKTNLSNFALYLISPNVALVESYGPRFLINKFWSLGGSVGVVVGKAAASGTGVGVSGTGVAVGGAGVAVAGTGVAVGGTGVAVGGTGVAVEGTAAGTDVAVETGVRVDVAVGAAVAG